MKTTSNLGLKKPEGTDIVDIGDLNGNMDTLDTAVKDLQDRAATSVPLTQKGAAGGVASLDATAKLPAGQLPSSAVQATTADVTYYVRTDGSDGNNGLANTAAGAFKTIGKAVNMVPQIVNHNAIINVGPGTYNEVVTIAGRGGSAILQINGDSVLSASRSVHSFFVTGCSCRVEVIGFTGYRNDGEAFSARASAQVLFYRDIVTTAAPTSFGFYAEASSVILNECQASNRMVGVYSHVNGRILVSGMTGTGCSVGYRAALNGAISVQASTLTAAGALADSVSGGTLHTQTGVLNPWGDNNPDTRSFVDVSSATTQAISAAVTTKVLWVSKQSDLLNEFFDSAFTAKYKGRYMITGSIHLSGFTIGSYIDLTFFANGLPFRTTRFYYNYSTQNLSFNVISPLDAGDTISVSVSATSDGVLGAAGDGTRTYMLIQRIA